MRAKIEKVTFVEGSAWEWPKGSGTFNYNFIVKLDGVDDKRYIHVSKDQSNPKFIAGQEAEFTVDESRLIKASIGGKTYEYPKIELVKQNPFNGGGGGGGKSYVKSPEQFRNEIVSFCGGYAIQAICHRTTLGKDAEDIVKQYEILVDGFFKALSKHIK